MNVDSLSDKSLFTGNNTLTSNFIGEYFLDDLSVCDDLIDFFHNSAYGKTNHRQGITTSGYDEKVKKSTDLEITPQMTFSANSNYMRQLQSCCEKYIAQYPACNIASPWRIVENYNIQWYKPGEGFFAFHCERGNSREPSNARHLVWMTYLNDVEDGGGTEFYNQNTIFKAEKGKTLIWPCDWTYTHRGQVSPTEHKYIITGWYSFYSDPTKPGS
ncbi:prolyl 4-hydroxylase [Synechococcus phage S-B64]|uniref:Prolyl 4-hydroxylase n=2 Tax=Shandvirus TaxID=2948904 RepID=A0A1Z1LW93_9CAUD|nr:2OG-Fe(II) oxygenase [Synechococcus phage S-H35]YP_010095376.1 2OG-Fe(II) oxygenase [Synechococcus phage S-B64]ARW56938.1 prolyl 4-hydroxylase [Synechococcus phage S-H35]AWD90174.1 prolyl 4-hydroxylase [Synechococcus phage S-B64]